MAKSNKKSGAEMLAELATAPTSTMHDDGSAATAPSGGGQHHVDDAATVTDAHLEAQRVMVIAISQIPSDAARARALKEYTNSAGIGIVPDGSGALRCFPNGVAGAELVDLIERNAGFIGVHVFHIGFMTGALRVEGALYTARLPQPPPTEWDLTKTGLIENCLAAAKMQGWAAGHITRITERLRDSLQEGDRVGGVDFFAVAIQKPGGQTVTLSRFDD
jgi:hypothetical protein